MSYTIVRTFNGKPRQIVLTDREIEAIFRYRDLQYAKEDAKRHILMRVGYEYEEIDDVEEDVKEKFEKEFGISLETLISDDEALEYLCERFSDEIDCNRPENDIWDEIVVEYLDELRAQKGSTTNVPA